MKSVGLRRQAPTIDLCFFLVFRDQGQAVGAFTTHIDDISGFGETDVLETIRHLLEKRLRTMKLREDSFVHVGMGLAQDGNFSATITQGELAKNLQTLLTSPQLRAARQKLLSPEDAKLRQCKLGELSCLSAVARPDICAKLARIASCINALQGGDAYRINDLVATVGKWRPATV